MSRLGFRLLCPARLAPGGLLILFTPMRGLHLSEDVRLNYLVAARGR